MLIGLASAFGSAALVGLILYIIYFFKYTSHGRILLDRFGRPGEFDDEQAFLREEAEALERMDDISRQEYLRAKGENLDKVQRGIVTNFLQQRLYNRIHLIQYRQTFHYHSFWPFKRRGFRHGSLRRSWKLRTASSRLGQK